MEAHAAAHVHDVIYTLCIIVHVYYSEDIVIIYIASYNVACSLK